MTELSHLENESKKLSWSDAAIKNIVKESVFQDLTYKTVTSFLVFNISIFLIWDKKVRFFCLFVFGIKPRMMKLTSPALGTMGEE